MFDFSNYSSKSKHDVSNKLFVGKMKDETGGVAIEEFVGLKSKINFFGADVKREHKKTKGVNKNVFVTISHRERKDVLLYNKCLRHSMKIQSKSHSIGIYKIINFFYYALMICIS